MPSTQSALYGPQTTTSFAPVRGVATSNVSNLASCSTTLDGLTLVEGNRIALIGQSTASQNGVYVVGVVATGAAPLTRAEDANKSSDWIGGKDFVCLEGTVNAGKRFRVTNTGAITIGSTNITIVSDTGIIRHAAPSGAADQVGLGWTDANGAATAARHTTFEGGSAEIDRVMTASATVHRLTWGATVADDGTIALKAPTTRAYVEVWESGGVEHGFYTVAPDGTVTVDARSSTNAVGTDTDAKLCLYNNSGTPTVKNRLGGSRDVLVSYTSF